MNAILKMIFLFALSLSLVACGILDQESQVEDQSTEPSLLGDFTASQSLEHTSLSSEKDKYIMIYLEDEMEFINVKVDSNNQIDTNIIYKGNLNFHDGDYQSKNGELNCYTLGKEGRYKYGPAICNFIWEASDGAIIASVSSGMRDTAFAQELVLIDDIGDENQSTHESLYVKKINANDFDKSQMDSPIEKALLELVYQGDVYQTYTGLYIIREVNGYIWKVEISDGALVVLSKD